MKWTLTEIEINNNHFNDNINNSKNDNNDNNHKNKK